MKLSSKIHTPQRRSRCVVRLSYQTVISLDPTMWVQALLADSTAHLVVLPFAIILGTFILEDLTTILVGILAATGGIEPWLALVSLYAGIVLGDCGLYGLGALSRTHPRIDRFTRHEQLQIFKRTLERSMREAVVTARFLPGMRLPTYVACGFFRLPFKVFALWAIVSTLIWTTILFGLSYLFGYATDSLLGYWRWSIALAAAVAIFLIGRYRLKHLRMEHD